LEERECPAVFNIANGDTPALIAAINAANSNNQADTINLASKGTYDFTTADNGASGGSALPVIVPDNNNPANTITINGNGATLMRDPGAATNFRILNIEGGRIVLDSVVLTDGASSGGLFGGAIRVNDLSGVNGSLDNLVVRRSLLTGNTSSADGGAIALVFGAKATVVNSTITGNTAQNNGGGIEVNADATNHLDVVNVTISRNVATTQQGGGINVDGGLANVINSILSDNHTTSLAGPENDLRREGGTVNARNSLFNDPATAANLTTSVNDIINVNPNLSTLKNNGGTTPTIAILTGSPAINTGDTSLAQGPTDQRGTGFNRTIGGTVDMGAYEFQPPAVTVGLTSSKNPSTFGDAVTFTATVAAVAAGSNTPQGTMSFFIDGALLGTVTLVNGTAIGSTASLSVGSHSVRAVYNPQVTGDYSFSSGSSSILTQRVIAASVVPRGRRWQR
jgi:hypothetical protein